MISRVRGRFIDFERVDRDPLGTRCMIRERILEDSHVGVAALWGLPFFDSRKANLIGIDESLKSPTHVGRVTVIR